jgi:hypothetical protein
MTALKIHVLLALVLALSAAAFTVPKPKVMTTLSQSRQFSPTVFFMSKDEGVVELVEDETTPEEKVPDQQAVAPFLSQGEISEEPMDLSDPKQARVMFYIILSLIPVLFLIPLMLGSREMIPADILPPVEMM